MVDAAMSERTFKGTSWPMTLVIWACRKTVVVATLLFALTASLPAVTIAPTDALSPEEQKKKFNIPDGFVIELVVAEPEIGQPMNLNFDARGRLWVSSSIEYPFPAKGDVDKSGGRFSRISGHPPGDWLTVVSDLDESGSCLLYTSPSPRDRSLSRMPSSA